MLKEFDVDIINLSSTLSYTDETSKARERENLVPGENSLRHE